MGRGESEMRTAGRVSVVHAGSGTAAQGVNKRETELVNRSLRLRDDARAAPPGSPVVCRIVGAPPLGAPARAIPAAMAADLLRAPA
jgi:hypothetical protein